MPKLASGWSIETDRGPDCLFVKLHISDECQSTNGELADRLWEILQQHLTNRLVIEVDEYAVLRSSVIGDLIVLHKRLLKQGGLMRICGLSEQSQHVMRTMRLDTWLPHYQNREAALMGMRPSQPR